MNEAFEKWWDNPETVITFDLRLTAETAFLAGRAAGLDEAAKLADEAVMASPDEISYFILKLKDKP